MAAEIDQEIIAYVRSLTEVEEAWPLLEYSVARVLSKLQSMRRNWREAAMAVDLRHVSDWIEVALLHREDWLYNTDEKSRPRKLMKFSDLDQIVREANKAMVRRSMLIPKIVIAEGEEVVEQVLDDGWYMVRLLTERALDSESAAMQHCVGHGTYDTAVRQGKVVILSLRDPRNRPHVTVEIDAKANSVTQIRGKQNERPRADYAKRVRAFLVSRNYESVYRPQEIGLIVDDMGVMHEVDNLPEGLSVRGSLVLGDCGIVDLPRFLEVSGDLVLTGSTVARLPDGLRVRGSLVATGSALVEFRLDHGISRHVDLTGCPVAALPDGLEVDGDLTLTDTPIRDLPENLTVIGNLVAQRTDIRIFPASAVIARGIDLSGSGVRKFETPYLYVGGSLVLNECGRVHLPRRLYVEVSLFVEQTEVASGGQVVEIGKNLFCHGSNVTNAGGRVKVGERTYSRKRHSSDVRFALAVNERARDGWRGRQAPEPATPEMRDETEEEPQAPALPPPGA